MPDAPIPVTPSNLLGLEEPSLKAPETRIANGNSLRALNGKLLLEDMPRSRVRALVKGMLDGNPPYNDAQRRSNGLGWTCNINFMEGEALVDRARTPYYSIYNGVTDYADCCTGYQPDNPQNPQWGRIISKEFTRMLKRWDQFDWQMQQIIYWMVVHGTGPVIWELPGDWRFRAVASGMCLAPQNSASSVDNRIPFLMVRVQYRPHELYNFIRDEEAATARGWDVEAVKNEIKWASRGLLSGPNMNWNSAPWEYFQQLYKNNDLYCSFTSADTIYCCHAFVQEFAQPGEEPKVSHFITTEAQTAMGEGRQNGWEEDKSFLFKDTNCYDSYNECIQVFFQNIGDGTWHSVRGLATKAFKHLEVSNRLKCRMVDGAFIEASLTLQFPTTKSADKMQLTQVGPVTYIPAGCEVKSTKLAGFLDGPITVDRLLTNQLSSNIAMFTPRTMSREDGRGEVPTATQINAQVANESALNEGQITQWYIQEDALFNTAFNRAADPLTTDTEAQLFQQRCMDAGVPKQALAQMEYVRANRASGYGSANMRIMKLQQMQSVVPMLPVDGKKRWLDDYIAGVEGADKVERYNPPQHIPDGDDWMANVENAQMHEGKMPLISSGQDDEIHLHSHLADAGETLGPINQQIQQGQNPDMQTLQTAYQYVVILTQHCEAHIARLMTDPMRKSQGKYFNDQLAQLTSFNGKLRGAFREAVRNQQLVAEQKQQASALDALTQAKVDAIRQTTQSQTDARSTKATAEIQIHDAKAAAEIHTKTATTAHTMNMDTLKTAKQSKNGSV